jgi:hypothetical protein
MSLATDHIPDVIDTVFILEQAVSVNGEKVSAEKTKQLLVEACQGTYSDRFIWGGEPTRYFYLFEKERIILYGITSEHMEYDETVALRYSPGCSKMWDMITS